MSQSTHLQVVDLTDRRQLHPLTLLFVEVDDSSFSFDVLILQRGNHGLEIPRSAGRGLPASAGVSRVRVFPGGIRRITLVRWFQRSGSTHYDQKRRNNDGTDLPDFPELLYARRTQCNRQAVPGEVDAALADRTRTTLKTSCSPIWTHRGKIKVEGQVSKSVGSRRGGEVEGAVAEGEHHARSEVRLAELSEDCGMAEAGGKGGGAGEDEDGGWSR